MLHYSFVVIVSIGFVARISQAAVVEYTNKAQWQAAAGAYTTITFTELPPGTWWITDQYAPLGVLFTDGSDQVYMNQNGFPNDGYGLNGALDSSTLVFTQPMYTIAAEYPGHLAFKLYYHNQLIYTSSDFGGFGVGQFAGLISDQPFDRVFVYDPAGGMFIDDLHFGPRIPAPGALGLIALVAACARRRRQLCSTASARRLVAGAFSDNPRWRAHC